MADRKQELEKKKQRLEQMRAERKRAEEEKLKQREDVPSAGGAPARRADAEDILKDLGIHLPPEGESARSEHKSVSKENSSELQVQPVSLEQTSSVKKSAVLTVSKVTQTNIAPRETVTYCKETQTPKEVQEKEDEDADSLDVAVDTPPSGQGSHKMTSQHAGGTSHQTGDGVGGDDKGDDKQVTPAPVREMSEEEKRKILMSEEFNCFFSRASRVVERALFETVDIFTDYSGLDADDQDRALIEGEQVKLNRMFFDERWSKHRTVTSLDWSTLFPELLLTSYDNNVDAPNDPDGVVLVWSIKYKKNTPEYIFHSQSPVTSACFAKFHPNLIIGGTYSGQIVVWDNRSNKRTPVQRTPLSSLVHTHPVYCMSVIGTQNAHNLASVSSDGKMCYWNLDMLSQPQDSMELQWKQSKSVAAMCCSFPS